MARSFSEERVRLVSKEILTPYKREEVFSVSKEDAEKLLKADRSLTDFGPKYPVVKARPFDAKKGDEQLLLDNKYLNQEEHDLLQEKLHPGTVPKERLAEIAEARKEPEETVATKPAKAAVAK